MKTVDSQFYKFMFILSAVIKKNAPFKYASRGKQLKQKP